MQTELINISEKYQEQLLESNPDLISYLLAGNFHNFETKLFQSCADLYNQITFFILSAVAQSEEFKQKVQVIGQNKGIKEPGKSEVKLQLTTGDLITIFSWNVSPASSIIWSKSLCFETGAFPEYFY